MKKQSLSNNFAFQFLYQGIILVIPLFLAPYLTRTLYETALGEYGFIHSISYYFLIAAMLGISRHGQRLISRDLILEDETVLRKSFWSLYSVHAIWSIVILCFYLAFVSYFVKEYKELYFIESIYVASAIFDVTWLFYGCENFRVVVVRNTAIKLFECILIFLYVKSPNDLWKYVLITAGGTCAGHVIMIPRVIRLVHPIHFQKSDVLVHIKPLLVFSISVFAVTLYTVFDKTLLGLMTTKDNVAFYEYSNKLITIGTSVLSVVGTVMFPRACRMAAEGRKKEQGIYIQMSFVIVFFISVAFVFGFISIADLFAVIYYGRAFAVCGTIIKVFSPLVFVIGTGDILRTQIMIPNGLDKEFNLCILLNAIVNIILSVILIPMIGVYGAVVGTISAELFGLVFQMIVCRKYFELKNVLIDFFAFVLIGFIMMLTIRFFAGMLNSNLKALAVYIIIGMIVYLGLSIPYIIIKHKEYIRLLLQK